MVPECVNRCYMKSGWGVVPLTGLSWVKFLLKERENLCDYHDKHIFFLHKTVYSSRVLSTCVIMGIVFLFKMWFVCLFIYFIPVFFSLHRFILLYLYFLTLQSKSCRLQKIAERKKEANNRYHFKLTCNILFQGLTPLNVGIVRWGG